MSARSPACKWFLALWRWLSGGGYTSLEANTYDSLLTCRKCGWSGSYVYLEDIDPFTYCPGCGREIQERR